MNYGSCQCGAVAYAIDGELGDIVLCHCSQCRKAQGTAFAANAPVDASRFSFNRGADVIVEYESSPGKRRAFCPRCGSPIYSRHDQKPGVLRVRVGTLDTPLEKRPVAHIFASSKAPWDEICDALPQYDGREPGR